MYGKTLSDFPDRFDEFWDEFKDTPPAMLDEAFRLARGVCEDFPTIADVRKQLGNVKSSDEIEAAYERLKQRILAQPEAKQLKSVLDEKQAVAKRPLRLLTEAEHNERVEYLKRQVKP